MSAEETKDGIHGQRVRKGKGHESISRDALQDPRLSFKATGMLAFLLSLPDNWRTDAERLSKSKNAAGKAREGREAIQAGLRELEDAGYLRRRKYQDEQGRWRWSWRYSDNPSDLLNQDVSPGQTGNGSPDDGSTDAGSAGHGSPVDLEVLEVEVLQRDTTDKETLSSEVADATPDQPRPDIDQLCTTLVQAMTSNGCKPPTVTKAWKDAARLLLDKDQRPLDEALAVLAWCQQDQFWQVNIHSLPKFRAKYDQLRLRWLQTKPARPLNTTDAIKRWLREQYDLGHVNAVEERSGIRYPDPDLPAGIRTVEEAREFHATAIRDWIKANVDRLITAIQQREQRDRAMAESGVAS